MLWGQARGSRLEREDRIAGRSRGSVVEGARGFVGCGRGVQLAKGTQGSLSVNKVVVYEVWRTEDLLFRLKGAKTLRICMNSGMCVRQSPKSLFSLQITELMSSKTRIC